jgi:hypothetical protein
VRGYPGPVRAEKPERPSGDVKGTRRRQIYAEQRRVVPARHKDRREGPRRMPSRPVPSRQQARPKFEDAPASVAAGRVAGTLARHFA